MQEFAQNFNQRVGGNRLVLQDVLDQLIADGFIAKEKATRAMAGTRWSRRDELHPLVIIANQKIESLRSPYKPLSLEALTYWMAEKAGLPYHRIDPLKVDVAAVTVLVSYAYAARHRILPLAVTDTDVLVATSEPFVREWQNDLKQLWRKQIQLVMANPLDINRYLLEFYNLSKSVRGARYDQEAQNASDVLNFEQLLELGKSGDLSADDRPVVQIVDWLLQYAFEQRASDIHLEPRRDKGHFRFRIDGSLHPVYQIPPAVMNAVTSRIKILGRMDVAEKRRPQDGRIKTRSPAGREVELRLSTMPTAFGEKCVMRIFDPDVVARNFSELGFADDELRVWKDMVGRPHGIVLVTGPTGSGKTTTLYSTLKYLARPEINVCTVEDPIEMVSEELNQMQVQPNIGLSFAQGIRTLLRQDPDIIMVGEIRDLETAQMAIQASLTGHLVLSTLHTNDAPSAITRLLDIGVPHYLLNGTLAGVVAQRLVRTLCPHCKIEGVVPEPLWETLVGIWPIERPQRVARPKGCLECRNSGYLGRTAIYEMLTVTAELRKLFKDDPDTVLIRQQAIADGMRLLRAGGAEQVVAGITTVEEVLKVVPPPEL